MERRKVIKKNEPKHRVIKKPDKVINTNAGSICGTVTVAKATNRTQTGQRIVRKKTGSKLPLPLTLYFFDKPLLYKAFEDIAKEKEIPMRELIVSFAALGLKAYLEEKPFVSTL
jgi:hypothetical protein